MKSIEEIQEMLVFELHKHLSNIKRQDKKLKYYNEILGDTSFILAGLLGELLKKKFNDWDLQKWMDDCLITKLNLKNEKLSIWGIMIWGIENNGFEQWTEPFYFEIDLEYQEVSFNNYAFLFSDLHQPEISYSDFKLNRDCWGEEYYKDDSWNFSEKDWRYIINVKIE